MIYDDYYQMNKKLNSLIILYKKSNYFPQKKNQNIRVIIK